MSLPALFGCFSFLKALASICLILSLVTENCLPTSSRVLSLSMPMPNLILRTLSSLEVRPDNNVLVISFRLLYIVAFNGDTADLSSMKSPTMLSSSSLPTGDSKLTGSLAVLKTFLTFSTGIKSLSAISWAVGFLPSSWVNCLEAFDILLIVSTM